MFRMMSDVTGAPSSLDVSPSKLSQLPPLPAPAAHTVAFDAKTTAVPHPTKSFLTTAFDELSSEAGRAKVSFDDEDADSVSAPSPEPTVANAAAKPSPPSLTSDGSAISPSSATQAAKVDTSLSAEIAPASNVHLVGHGDANSTVQLVGHGDANSTDPSISASVTPADSSRVPLKLQHRSSTVATLQDDTQASLEENQVESEDVQQAVQPAYLFGEAPADGPPVFAFEGFERFLVAPRPRTVSERRPPRVPILDTYQDSWEAPAPVITRSPVRDSRAASGRSSMDVSPAAKPTTSVHHDSHEQIPATTNKALVVKIATLTATIPTRPIIRRPTLKNVASASAVVAPPASVNKSSPTPFPELEEGEIPQVPQQTTKAPKRSLETAFGAPQHELLLPAPTGTLPLSSRNNRPPLPAPPRRPLVTPTFPSQNGPQLASIVNDTAESLSKAKRARVNRQRKMAATAQAVETLTNEVDEAYKELEEVYRELDAMRKLKDRAAQDLDEVKKKNSNLDRVVLQLKRENREMKTDLAVVYGRSLLEQVTDSVLERSGYPHVKTASQSKKHSKVFGSEPRAHRFIAEFRDIIREQGLKLWELEAGNKYRDYSDRIHKAFNRLFDRSFYKSPYVSKTEEKLFDGIWDAIHRLKLVLKSL